MVEPIKPIEPSKVQPSTTGAKVSADDLTQLQKLHTQIEALKQVQKVTKGAAKAQVNKNRLSSAKSTPSTPTSDLPAGVQKAYSEQIEAMKQLISIIQKEGNPSWKPLLDLYLKNLKALPTPPNSDEGATLDTMMEELNGLALTLPKEGKNTYFSLEVTLYTKMLALAKGDPTYSAQFSKALSYARSQVKNLPTTGSYLQKALQPLIKTEVEKLRELTLFLLAYAPPQFRGELKGYEQQLDAIASHLPKVSEQDLNALSNILNGMDKIAAQLPNKSTQATYWSTEAKLYQTLAQMGEATTDDNAIIYEKLQETEGILQKWEGGATPSQRDVQIVMRDLEVLMQNSDVLSYGDSQALEKLLDGLGGINGGTLPGLSQKESNISELVVLDIQYQIVEKYIAEAGKNASLSGLQNFTKKYVKNPANFPQTNNPLFQSLEKRLTDISPLIKTKDNPTPALFFATLEKGKMTLNSGVMNQITADFSKGKLQPTGTSWSALISTLQEAQNNYNPQENGLQTLLNMINDFQIGAGVAYARAEGVDSLADLFATDVINRYMPQQQAMLSGLSINMKFNNLAGGIDQNLLKIMEGFSSAGTDFSFASLLGEESKDGFYYGSAVTAKQTLEKEQKAVQSDLKSLNTASDQIDQDITKLTLDHDFDGDPYLVAQKNRLIEQLQSYKKTILKAIDQVTKVGNDLSGVKIYGHSNGFTVEGLNTTTLAQDEYTAAHGDPDSNPPGGLLPLQTTIHGNMQDYTNTNTTQQYNMEMVMTKVQQEWSLTSTCISTLNASYMAFARAINK